MFGVRQNDTPYFFTVKKRFASVKVILRQPKRVLTREQIRNTYSKLFNPQKLNPNK